MASLMVITNDKISLSVVDEINNAEMVICDKVSGIDMNGIVSTSRIEHTREQIKLSVGVINLRK